jgi:hypothetical protein
MTLSFRLIDRLFWLVWIGFPFAFLGTAELGGLDPAQTPPDICLPWLPDYSVLTPLGQALLWVRFGAEFMVWGIGLALAHWVIHRAAKGQVFATDILWPVRSMGLLLLVWPMASVILDNLTAWSLAGLIPGQVYEPIWMPNIIIMGFGLFLMMIATVLGQAVDLARDAELTI